MICGADDFVSIAHWAGTKRKWLATFLDLSAGIPSHDRFNAILGRSNLPSSRSVCSLDHGLA